MLKERTFMTGFASIMALIVLISVSVSPTLAQGDREACPVLVETALAIVDEACTDIGRNEVCYGHGNIHALDFGNQQLAGFGASGDIESLSNVYSLATAAMDATEDVWGIAILSIQANLPDTAAGANVRFVVFGDTQLVSEVAMGSEGSQSPPRIPFRSSDNINVRSGPGTGYALVGVLASDEEVIAVGRNAAGDWVQIVYGDGVAWVYTPLMTIAADDGVIDDLIVLDAGETVSINYSAPMQAFRFSTGIGEVQCEEAPKDGLLVQAPTDTVVNFLIKYLSEK